MIGYAFTGSFCTLSASLSELEWLLSAGFDIQPIMSENAYSTDTRFFKAEDFTVLSKIVIKITLPASVLANTAGMEITVNGLSRSGGEKYEYYKKLLQEVKELAEGAAV